MVIHAEYDSNDIAEQCLHESSVQAFYCYIFFEQIDKLIMKSKKKLILYCVTIRFRDGSNFVGTSYPQINTLHELINFGYKTIHVLPFV